MKTDETILARARLVIALKIAIKEIHLLDRLITDLLYKARETKHG